MFSTISSAFSFICLLSSLPHILAADCYGGSGVDPDVGNTWILRQQMCGDNVCANSDADRGNNHFCTLYLPYNDGTSQIQLQRNDPSGNFEYWYVFLHNDRRNSIANVVFYHSWDAFADIIDQCFNNPSGSGLTSSDPNGSWKLGDEWYWVSILHNDLNEPSGEEYSVGEPE